jgi:3-oxoacid CoA-transferase B subunit/3-oxoacid CoA-transferase A subunit
MKERLTRELMALRAACELKSGQVVNLGFGIPTLVSNYITDCMDITLHSENGLLGFGPEPDGEIFEADLVNAAGVPVTLFPGGVAISQIDAFGIVRSGKLDISILGAMQVSEAGDLSNWLLPSKGVGSPGGAIDIAHGTKKLVVLMEHTDNQGSPKILKNCSYPVTACGKVSLIITDVAVIEVKDKRLVLRETAPGWSPVEIQEITEPQLVIPKNVLQMDFAREPVVSPSKIFQNVDHALSDIFDGAVILMDGFGGLGGMSHFLMVSLREQGAMDLTLVSNTAGIARVSSFGRPPSSGLQAIDHSILIESGQVKRVIASFPVSPSPSRPSAFEKALRDRKVDLELVPQGTLAERLRAGAFGIGAFFTPTGIGTIVEYGKESRIIENKEFILEKALVGDFAFIRAHKSDTKGNLIYKGTSRNFNSIMAQAATITIAEVDEIVESGELDPDEIVTPGVFVDRIVVRPKHFSPFVPINELTDD